MPGPSPSKRVPISVTRAESRSGSAREPGELSARSFMSRSSRNSASYSSLDFCRRATGMPSSCTRTSRAGSGSAVEAGTRDAGEVEAEAPVGEALRHDRVVDRQLEPDDLPAVDRLDPPIRRQRVEQRQPPSRGSLPPVLLDGGKRRIAVGHVDPDAIGKDVQGHAHRRGGMQHRVGHQLRRQQGGGAGHLRRQVAQVRGHPMARQGCALHHRFEVQRRHAITCRTHRLDRLCAPPRSRRSSGRAPRDRRCARRRSAWRRTWRPAGPASPSRAISVAVEASRSIPSVITSPRRSMSPSEYMISESPRSSTSSSSGRGAPFRPAASRSERCIGQ